MSVDTLVRASAQTQADPVLGRRIASQVARLVDEISPAMPNLHRALRDLGCAGGLSHASVDPAGVFVQDGRVTGVVRVHLELAYRDARGRARTSTQAVDGVFDGTLDARGAFEATRLAVDFDALLD